MAKKRKKMSYDDMGACLATARAHLLHVKTSVDGALGLLDREFDRWREHAKPNTRVPKPAKKKS